MADETGEPTGDGGNTITIRRDFGVFMAGVWEQSQRDYQFTVNALLDAANTRADRAETTLSLVREVIGRLLNGDYMPTSAAIERALYPSWDLIERLRSEQGSA